jgi:hypothetical protein
VPLPKIEREEMRFLTPANLVNLAEAIPARYRALVFVGAYGGLRIGELAGLRQSRVDLLAGAVTVAEILTEFKGKLIAGRRDAQRRSPCAGHTSVSFTLAAAATRRSLAGRGGPVPSGKGLDYGVRQHGRKPQDGRSPG